MTRLVYRAAAAYQMKRIALLFTAVALLYAGPGLLPGRTLAPLDLPLDLGAWKANPAERVRVSNSLLADVIVQFVAWDREIINLISEGELPWVNRFAGEGAPLFANPQTAIFSPFTWPRLIFGLDGWALTAILKLLAAALCAYWFARELDVARRQAVVSALVYATSGYTIVWLLYPITNVFAILPGLAAAAFRLMKWPSIHNAASVIAFAALCTAGGHPETLFIGVVGIWIFLLWEAERRRDLRAAAVVPSSVGALLGFLLFSVQLVPFFAVLGSSYSGALRPLLDHQFRIWGVASQILPGILGSPLRGELDLTALPSAENFNVRAGGYIGAITLLCIVLAYRHLSPTLRRCVIIAAIALVISWYPPGLWTVLRHVPVVRVLALEYCVALTVLFGAVAAGPAIAIVASRQRRKIGALVVAAGLIGMIVGMLPLIPAARETLSTIARSGIEHLRDRGHFQHPAAVYEQRLEYYLGAAGATTMRRVAAPGLFWFAAGLALLLPIRRRELFVSAAVAGELFTFGVGFNPAVRMTTIPDAPPAITAMTRLDPSRSFFLASHIETFPANLATLYRVRDIISYDALMPRDSVQLLLGAGYDPLLHSFNPILAPAEVQTLAANGVRFVLSRSDVAGAQRIGGAAAPAVGLYEIAGATPTPLPANSSPPGLVTGIVISLLAFLASAAWLRLYTLQPAADRDAAPAIGT